MSDWLETLFDRVAHLVALLLVFLFCTAARAQELDVSPSTNMSSSGGPELIAGIEGKFRDRATATAAFTRQNKSGLTAGLAQLEWQLGGGFKLLGAAGYAVSDLETVTHAVDLRAGFTYLRALDQRVKLQNQTMVEGLIQDAQTGDLVRFRSRSEVGYQLLARSARKPILFTSVEPIADQQHRGIQQVRVQAGLMATFGRVATQLYYRRQEIISGQEQSRNALFIRAILRVGKKAEMD